jgi:HD superfamily phosphohydrolase
MVFKDRVYGILRINSPVVIELMKSKSVQRLKKISQMGPPDKYYHLKGYSRFEHSIGVMLLLKHLDASEEEQIAGLLHDISHSTFSHLIDWVIGTGHTEEFQDNQHEKYLLNSEIKGILEKFGYNSTRIANNKNYSLLERDIPYLCADRIDYAIREFPLQIAKKCFAGFTVFGKKIVFRNKKSAKLFAVNFLKRQADHWGGYEAASRYVLFAQALKLALDDKLLVFSDFMKNEDFVITKLELSKNIKIKLILNTLRNKDLSSLPKTAKRYHKKFRYVDPEFIKKNKLIRLSTVDKQFKQLIEQAKEDNREGIRVPII